MVLEKELLPGVAAQRNLLFEEPRGRENIKLVNKKFVPHKDTAGSFKMDI